MSLDGVAGYFTSATSRSPLTLGTFCYADISRVEYLAGLMDLVDRTMFASNLEAVLGSGSDVGCVF
jgi:hypothetical protein